MSQGGVNEWTRDSIWMQPEFSCWWCEPPVMWISPCKLKRTNQKSGLPNHCWLASQTETEVRMMLIRLLKLEKRFSCYKSSKHTGKKDGNWQGKKKQKNLVLVIRMECTFYLILPYSNHYHIGCHQIISETIPPLSAKYNNLSSYNLTVILSIIKQNERKT